MPRISDDAIEQTRRASDLVDVVGDRVRLKKQGRRFVGLCPFHNEKSPSFSVDPAEGLYYCFGCLDAAEPVWTRRGLIPIGDVVVGDQVLGIDGCEEVVTEVLPKQGAVLALHLASVRRDPLVLTPDHTCVVVRESEAVRTVPMLYRDRTRGVRFQSRKRGYRTERVPRVAEVRADAVQTGDYFLFPVLPDARRSPASLRPARQRVPTPELAVAHGAMPETDRGPRPRLLEGLPVTTAAVRLYGLWLAGGSVYPGGVRWSFHLDETHLADEVVATLARTFGLSACVHRRPARTLLEVTCSNTHLSCLLPHWFGKGAASKRIPAEALAWPREIQAAFLDAYAEGDATRTSERDRLATSVSPDLVRGLYAVAIQARRPVSMARGRHRTTADREVWALSLRGLENAGSFYHEVNGLVHYWSRVDDAVALDGGRAVVDINVTGSRTFTTKLGAVHNCKKGGDVFRFVQETEGVGFLDAVRLLADKAGIELDEGPPDPNADRKEAMTAALRFAARFYFDQLKTEAGARGLAYLQSRGFSKETVQAFGIGVAPAGWDALVVAATEAGHAPEILEAVGLAKTRSNGGHYDAFRDRLMFPILSPIGKVLGFGGRILPDTQTGSADYTPAKYINSPDTEVYQKSRELYGLKQAKRSIRAEEEAIVVEGYADVVSLAQAGIENVIAASGTALTPQQISLLSKTARTLVLLFDADQAGQTAARKAIDTALAGGLMPYAVPLPDGADPDSYVRQFGADAFRTRLAEERIDFVDFLARRAEAAGALASPEGKAAAVREAADALARMTDELLRGEYLRRAADAFDVDEVALRREVVAAGKRPRRRDERPGSADDRFGAPAGTPDRRNERPGQAPFAPLPDEAPLDRADDEVPGGGAPAVPDLLRPAIPTATQPEQALLRLMLREGMTMVEHVMTRIGLDLFTDGPPRELAAALLDQYNAGAITKDPFVRGDHGEPLRALAMELLPERYVPSERAETKGLKPVSRDQKPFEVAKSSIQLLQIDRIEEAEAAVRKRIKAAQEKGVDTDPLVRELMDLTDIRRRIEAGDSLLDTA